MLTAVKDVPNSSGMTEEQKRACNDMLKNAQTGMMSWAEKNFRHKLIDNLFKLGYYSSNQTIYLSTPKQEKE